MDYAIIQLNRLFLISDACVFYSEGPAAPVCHAFATDALHNV